MVRKNEQAALSVAPAEEPTKLASASVIDDFDFGDVDGLQEADGDDLRLPVIVWNLKGMDPATQQMRQLNEFYDTLNETTHRELRCAFVHLHKTRLFSRYDNDKSENIVYCNSSDRVLGRMRTQHPSLPVAEGTERKCETCPDREWFKNQKGKNERNCDDVYGVFAAHLDEQLRPGDGFLIRFKRTGLQPFKTYLQKYHLNKRRLSNGQQKNMPLYVYEATLRLEVAKNGIYAFPIINKGRELPRETVAFLHDSAQYFAQRGAEVAAAADKVEARAEGPESTGGGDTARGEDFAD